MANVFSDATSDISVESGNPTHYVDWGAIAAGVFISLAVSSVFLAFGSAIGLSVTSFQPSASAPVVGLVIAAGSLVLVGADFQLYRRRLCCRPHAAAHRRCQSP